MERIRLLSGTAILTLLIWVSADSLVNEEASVTVAIALTPDPEAADMLVRLDAPTDKVEIRVLGPQRIIETLRTSDRRRLRLTVPRRPSGTENFTLDRQQIKDAIAQRSGDFRRLTVLDVQPDSLPVTVDHMVQRDVELTAKRLQMSYDAEPQIQPSRIAARLRESALAKFPADQPLQLDLSTDVERLLREQPFGKSTTVTVAVDKRSFGPDAELSPPTVEVTAAIKAQRRTETIPAVPVLVALSFANLQRPFAAVTRDGTPLSLVTQTITVTGANDEVARLLRGESRAVGLIHLKEDDFESMDVFKFVTPEYRLPKGIELVGDPQPIEFKLVHTSDTADGG